MINNFEELLEDLRDYLDAYQYQTDLVIGAGSKTLEWAIYDYLSHAVSDRMTLLKERFSQRQHYPAMTMKRPAPNQIALIL